jgi:hypothetical protein
MGEISTLAPTLVALFAAIVALTTPFIASSRQAHAEWREQRRITYNDFLAICAVRRRRLEAQARKAEKGVGLTNADQDERDEAREAVVADWNRVCLATDSPGLRKAAEGLMIVVDHLRKELDENGGITTTKIAGLQKVWDEHRVNYFKEARADLRLPA